MVLLITSLDDDSLRRIAAFAMHSKQSYWFAATCRAFKASLLAAAEDEHEAPETCLSTAFVSLKQLKHTLSVGCARAMIVGNGHAYGYHALLVSFDSAYRWTPVGVVQAYRSAPEAVIDYMTPNWKANIDNKPLVYAAAAGRVFMLDAMMLSSSSSTLANMLHMFAFDKNTPTPFFELNVFGPAMSHGATKTVQWVFQKLESLSSDGDWREKVGSTCERQLGDVAVRMLASAVESKYASRMLGYLTSTLFPRTIRATGLAYSQLQQTLLAVVLALLSDSCHVNAWRWLKMQTGSAYELWTVLSSMNSGTNTVFKVACRIDSRRVLHQILSTESADVYRWQREDIDEGGWLYENFHSHLYGLPRVRLVHDTSLSGLSPRAAYAWATWSHDRGNCMFSEHYAAARVDCLLNLSEYSDASRKKLSEWINTTDLRTSCDAYEEFFQRIGEIAAEHRFKTLRYVAEVMLPAHILGLLPHTDTASDDERVCKCLTARSEGGYGACGASLSRDTKVAISRSSTSGKIESLLRRSGMWEDGALGSIDKDAGMEVE